MADVPTTPTNAERLAYAYANMCGQRVEISMREGSRVVVGIVRYIDAAGSYVLDYPRLVRKERRGEVV